MEQERTQTASSPEPVTHPPKIAPRGFTRCRALNRSGSRCRLNAGAVTGLCPRHTLRPTTTPEDTDLSAHFTGKLDDFKSATNINDFLSTVAALVVKTRFPPAALPSSPTSPASSCAPSRKSSTNSLRTPTGWPESSSTTSPTRAPAPRTTSTPTNHPDDLQCLA